MTRRGSLWHPRRRRWTGLRDRPRLVGLGGRCGGRSVRTREAGEGGGRRTCQFMGHSRESGLYAMRTGKSPGLPRGTRRAVYIPVRPLRCSGEPGLGEAGSDPTREADVRWREQVVAGGGDVVGTARCRAHLNRWRHLRGSVRLSSYLPITTVYLFPEPS